MSIDYNSLGEDVTNEGREFGWDDEIQKDAPEFALLPEGDYDFEVVSFERGRHGGSEKLPPCNMAIIKLNISNNMGLAMIQHRLFLHSRTESRLSEFFIAIGQKKKDEKVKMNWQMVVGAKGRCKIITKTYNDKQYNEIKKFYDPAEAPAAASQYKNIWS